jgi:hypothetical protein
MRLLVSVRDAVEAREAIAGGADVIDVKEPLAGPLGRAGIDATLAVAAAVGRADRSVPWTFACGELSEPGGADVVAHAASLVGRLPAAAPPPWLVKVGLAGAAPRDWERELAGIDSHLPAGVAQACVVYADWRRCAAPPPERVVRLAGMLAGRMVLIDTFDKRDGGLFDVAEPGEIEDAVALAKSLGLAVALAGRLTLADADRVSSIAPDIVAVRTAACGGDRLQAVAASRVAAARRTLCRGIMTAATETMR